MVNDILILYKQTKLLESLNYYCMGLYCDKDSPYTGGRCLTICDDSASNVGNYIIIKPFDLTIIGNFTITGNQNGFGFKNLYDEANDEFKFTASTKYFL